MIPFSQTSNETYLNNLNNTEHSYAITNNISDSEWNKNSNANKEEINSSIDTNQNQNINYNGTDLRIITNLSKEIQSGNSPNSPTTPKIKEQNFAQDKNAKFNGRKFSLSISNESYDPKKFEFILAGKKIKEIFFNLDGSHLIAIEVSKDRKRLFTATNQSIKMYNYENSELIRTLKTNKVVNCIASVPDREIVFGGGASGRLFAFNYNYGTPYLPFKQMNRKIGPGELSNDLKRHHTRSINHIAIYKDFVLSCGDDNYIRQWKIDDGKLISEYQFEAPVTQFLVVNSDDSPWYKTLLLKHNPHLKLSPGEEIVILFVQLHHQMSCLACIVEKDSSSSPMFLSTFEFMSKLHVTSFSIIRNKLLAVYKRPFSKIEIYNFSNEILYTFNVYNSVFIHSLCEIEIEDKDIFALSYTNDKGIYFVYCHWKDLYSSQQKSILKNFTNFENKSCLGLEVIEKLERKGFRRTYSLQVFQIIMERFKGDIEKSEQDFLLYECLNELESEFDDDLSIDIPHFLKSKNNQNTYPLNFEYNKESKEIEFNYNLSKQKNYEINLGNLYKKLNNIKEKIDTLKSAELIIHSDKIFEEVTNFYSNDSLTNCPLVENISVVLINSDESKNKIEFKELIEKYILICLKKLFKPTDLSRKNSYYFEKHTPLRDFESLGRCISHCLINNIYLPNFDVSELIFKILSNDVLNFSDIAYIYPDIHRLLGRIVKKSTEHTDIETANGPALHYYDSGTREELIPDGRSKRVNMEDPGDYISLYAGHRLLNYVKDSILHFLKGFHSLIPREYVIGIPHELLQFAICGVSPDVHVYILKNHVIYTDVFYKMRERDTIIQWFWNVVEKSLTREERCKLYEIWSKEKIYRSYGTNMGGALLISGNDSISGNEFRLNIEESSLQISLDFKSSTELKDALLQFLKSHL